MAFNLEQVRAAIAKAGYALLKVEPATSLPEAMYELASDLRGTVLAGRGGEVLETLEMRGADRAPPRSLSRLSGVGGQPWHVDGSHLTVPPRYLILGCQSVIGSGAPPTQLLTTKDAGLPLPASHREPFIVRNGRSSFYSTIASTDRSWIRFDPGCMSAQTDEGHSIVKSLTSAQIRPGCNLDWKPGDILIFDNWKMLHRRGAASGIGRRTLLRISLVN